MPWSDGPPAFDAARAPLRQHRLQRFGPDLEGDVQVEVVLRLEFERQVVGLEEGEVRAVVEPKEGVQRVRVAAVLVRPISIVWTRGRPRKSS
jgi:hypothetical protein